MGRRLELALERTCSSRQRLARGGFA